MSKLLKVVNIPFWISFLYKINNKLKKKNTFYYITVWLLKTQSKIKFIINFKRLWKKKADAERQLDNSHIILFFVFVRSEYRSNVYKWFYGY